MEQITPLRTRQLQRGVELFVDEADFHFRSLEERDFWHQLVAEHERCLEKDDLVWIVDAA